MHRGWISAHHTVWGMIDYALWDLANHSLLPVSGSICNVFVVIEI